MRMKVEEREKREDKDGVCFHQCLARTTSLISRSHYLERRTNRNNYSPEKKKENGVSL